MREIFPSVHSLMCAYYALRRSLEAAKTCTPDPDRFRAGGHVRNSMAARSIEEEKFSFVGDVDVFLKRVQWWEAVILTSRVVPQGYKPRTYGQIALTLESRAKREGLYLPGRLIYRQHLHTELERVKKRAEKHFTEKGYLEVVNMEDYIK